MKRIEQSESCEDWLKQSIEITSTASERNAHSQYLRSKFSKVSRVPAYDFRDIVTSEYLSSMLCAKTLHNFPMDILRHVAHN